MYILETERLYLRQLALDDVDNLLEIFSDSVAMRYYPSIKDRAQTLEWIQWNLESYQKHGFGLWALIHKGSGEFVGECGLTMQMVDGESLEEIGYHVKRTYWGQGYATEAARACKKYAFDILQKSKVISWMHPENLQSRRVAEKNGMTLEKATTDRHGRSAVVYSITREQYVTRYETTNYARNSF